MKRVDALRGSEAPLGVVCHFCQRPVAKVKDAVLVLYDRELLRYPVKGCRGLLTHLSCGPDVGYAIQLSQLVQADAPPGSKSLRGWRDQLSEKSWWSWEALEDLEDAHVLARELAHVPLQPIAPSAPLVRVLGAISDTPRICSPGMRALVLERDGFACRRCGAKNADGAQLVIDHVVPYSAGGRTEIGNLQTLCWECNIGKGARSPHPHDLRKL